MEITEKRLHFLNPKHNRKMFVMEKKIKRYMVSNFWTYYFVQNVYVYEEWVDIHFIDILASESWKRLLLLNLLSLVSWLL